MLTRTAVNQMNGQMIFNFSLLKCVVTYVITSNYQLSVTDSLYLFVILLLRCYLFFAFSVPIFALLLVQILSALVSM